MTSRNRILVVEDRAPLRRMLCRALEGEGYRVVSAADGAEGIRRVQTESFDLVLSDLRLPKATGLEVLAACAALNTRPAVVVMTAYGTVSSAVEAMKLGAVDFLEKPVELEDLFGLVSGILEQGGPDVAQFEVEGSAPIVGSHPRIRAALHLLRRVAPTESTVLLTGESGTGKELFARALHALSPRANGPFIAVNCAAIPEALLENELFGHEKGAFTGAGRRQAGRFELASGGTLLLDEVAELPASVQAKILRVLEERSFERVGGGKTLKADVRLVAATNRDLAEMVAAKGFREDLYFRLDVFPIVLPALRERVSDIPALAQFLLGKLASRHGRVVPKLTSAAAELLSNQSWPGNVRQLSNLLERALILSDGDSLDIADLRSLVPKSSAVGEREVLRQALIDSEGDKKRAAAALGWSYRTLQRKVKELDLEGVPRYREG